VTGKSSPSQTPSHNTLISPDERAERVMFALRRNYVNKRKLLVDRLDLHFSIQVRQDTSCWRQSGLYNQGTEAVDAF